tara:strand:- start:594 stop:1343 length:750 start_codon:yes stop_codon:yes gene_type:complete
MVSKFEKQIDLEKFKRAFRLLNVLDLSKITNSKCRFVWEQKQTTFYNQITMVYHDAYSTKSIKLFPNGSIQVAGCSDLVDCKRIINQLSYIFKLIMGDTSFIAPIETFKVVMINSNFSLNYKINLLKVSRHFSKYPDIFKVSFEPDKYSAVKVKFKPANDMKEITTSIFGTGKIIITGAETLKEVAYGYNIINTTINDIEDVRVSPCEDSKKELFDQISGHKIESFIKHAKKLGFNSWKLTTENRQINF